MIQKEELPLAAVAQVDVGVADLLPRREVMGGQRLLRVSQSATTL